jgi:hypothetical protein
MKTAKRIAAAKAMAAIAGMTTMVLAAATGNWHVLFGVGAVAVAVVEGPVLVAAAAAFVADWKESIAQAAEDRRLHQMEAAVEQERGREHGTEERMAELKASYARINSDPEKGAGRFQELVSLNEALDPPGWHRWR